MLTENKIGVFVCHRETRGKEAIDTGELKKIARSFPQVQIVEDLYQDQWEASADRLAGAVSQKGLSHLIIASCHSSNYRNTFQQELGRLGLAPDQISLINILPEYLGVREEPDVVQERAALLLKQAIRQQQIAESHPLEVFETVPRLLIIGGDLAALLAAREALNLGYEVLVATTAEAFAQGGFHGGSRPDPDLGSWADLSRQPGVRLIPGARLTGFSGKAGDFEIFYRDGTDREGREKVGAVVVALPVSEEPIFGPYGLEPGRKILSLSQLEVLLASPAYKEKMLPGGKPTEVAFLLGLSSESSPGVAGRALANARLVQSLADSQVYFLSGNMKVAGPGLERDFTLAREEGVLFFRFDKERPHIQTTGQELRISFQDEALDLPLTLEPQIIVVDEKLAPHPDLKEISRLLGIATDAAGFLAPDQIYALPVRTPRKGIFAVSGSRRPVSDREDFLSEVQEALISAAELIGNGKRDLEAPRVEIDRKKCTICLTCVRSCPHQALHFLYRRPQISPLACQVCGICAAECPMDAIQIKNYRDQSITGEVSSFFSDRKFATQAPQVVVFCCKNSAANTLQQALLYREALPVGFEFVTVPCAGKIDPDYMLQALRQGADGVLVLACPIEGCKSFEGNKKARERVEFLEEILPETGLEAGRVQFRTVAPGMVAQFLQICYEMEDTFRKMGISPVRRGLGIQRIYDKFTFPVDSKTFLV